MTKVINPAKAASGLMLSKLSRAVVLCLLVLIVLAVFVPLQPAMPSAGLDPSWAFGMNQAIAQGLVFGKDIVFTFGPYASVYTRMYHPATDRMMVLASLFLGLCYSAAVLLLARKTSLIWIVIFGAFLCGRLFVSEDSLLLSYPLLVAAVVYGDILADDDNIASSPWRLSPPVLVLLFAPLGLLPLVKGSFLLLSGGITLLCFIAFWRLKKRLSAWCCIVTPLVTMVACWLLAGQSLLALPYYFLRMFSIISGYTEAMALPGNYEETLAYLLASVAILCVAGATGRRTPFSRLFLFLSFLLFLFVAFKNGFVRHDGHAIIAATSLLFAALLLSFTARSRQATAVFLLAVLVWAYIDQGYVGSSTKSYFGNVRATYRDVTHGLKLRRSSGNKLKAMFDQGLQSLNAEGKIPRLKGTVDIYPEEQAYLLASGNVWSPRPVLQSYSAYTPALAQLDASHLTGARAPDNIVFKVEPLNDRFPSLDDGLSWPVLVNDYSPVKMDGGLLYLVHNPSAGPVSFMEPLSTETHSLGETVSLPDSPAPLIAELDIHQSFIGDLVSFLYKPTPLSITVDLNNGTSMTYRMVSSMAKTGFVISPLIERTEDFALLFGDESYWSERRVKAIRVAPASGKSMMWRFRYVLKLSKLALRPQTNVDELLHLDRVDEEYSKQTEEPATGACDGSIDQVNGLSPAPKTAKSSRLLSVSGWLLVSAKDAVVPDAVFVTLTDEHGKTTYLKTQQVPRDDVKVYFHHPEMGDVGYEIYADVPELDGKYYLGLARTYEGKLEACQQFHIPISIGRAQ